jgi:hypothetical protein
MNYFSFALLSQTDKLKEIRKNGILIAERSDRFYHYELYQFNNYYAEKQSDRAGRVSQISKTFKAASYLDPYLDTIDITSVVVR